MNISRDDAVAQLAKWHDSGTQIRATYTAGTGNSFVVGRIGDLSTSVIRVKGEGCEMVLYFRATSEYDYKDVREPSTEANSKRENKYPTVIVVKFSNGDLLDIRECFSE